MHYMYKETTIDKIISHVYYIPVSEILRREKRRESDAMKNKLTTAIYKLSAEFTHKNNIIEKSDLVKE